MKNMRVYLYAFLMGLFLVASPVFGTSHPVDGGATQQPAAGTSTGTTTGGTTGATGGTTTSCIPTAANNNCGMGTGGATGGTTGTAAQCSTGQFQCMSMHNACATKEQCDAADAAARSTTQTNTNTTNVMQTDMKPCAAGQQPTAAVPCKMDSTSMSQQTDMKPCAAGQQPTAAVPCKMDSSTTTQPDMSKLPACGADGQKFVNGMPSCRMDATTKATTDTLTCGDGEHRDWDQVSNKPVCKKNTDTTRTRSEDSNLHSGDTRMSDREGGDHGDRGMGDMMGNMGEMKECTEGQSPMKDRCIPQKCAENQFPTFEKPCMMSMPNFSKGPRSMENRSLTDSGKDTRSTNKKSFSKNTDSRQLKSRDENKKAQEESTADMPPCPIMGGSTGGCRPPTDEEVTKMIEEMDKEQDQRDAAFKKQMDQSRFKRMKSHLTDLERVIGMMKARLVPLKKMCNVFSDVPEIGAFYPQELDDMMVSAEKAFNAVKEAENGDDLDKAMNDFMLLKSSNSKWSGGRISELYDFCENFNRAKETVYRMLVRVKNELSLAKTLEEDGDTVGAGEANDRAYTLGMKTITLNERLVESVADYRRDGAFSGSDVIETNFFGQLNNNKLYKKLIPPFDDFNYQDFRIDDSFMMERTPQGAERAMRLEKQKRRLASNQ